MKIKFTLQIVAVIIAVISLCGCSSDDPITPEVTISNGSTDYFTEAMDFPSYGGKKILNFTSNVKWTLRASETQNNSNWCTISQSEGDAGSYNIIITVGENAGYDDRNVVLVLTAGELKKNVIINQKQKNALTLTTSRFEVGAEGGMIDVEIKANVDYKIEIPAECQNWITQASKTRALSTKSLSFNIAESKEYDKREGKIIVSSGELSETITVYQSGSSILVLSQNEYTLGSEGGSVDIDISSNFQYEVDMPNVDWVKSAPNIRAVSSHTLKYIISENTSYDDREAVIVFKDSNGDKKESVTIKQRQKDAILLSSKKVEISQDGGTFLVGVNSNVDYSIEIPPTCSNWIGRLTSSNAKTRAIVKTTPSFKVSNSEQYDKREGEIYFKYKNIADTLRVYQSGGAILVLSKSDYNLEGGATTISVELKSNIEYSVKPSVDWITEISTRAVSSSTKSFKISANKTGNSRTGKITFTASDGTKTATVTVVQATLYGSIGGHGYVDLALPSGKLWSTTNFGGWRETDSGSYYMWSSTDRVPSSWGNKWATPTRSEINELLSYCNYTWTTKDGVNGYLFTGSNGATMFLPAAGFKNYVEGYGYSNVQSGGKYVLYWTRDKSSYSWEGQDFAFALQGNSSSLNANSTYNTTIVAAPIRPISR